MHDVVIVGGGVIGLSLAYQLAAHQHSVCVLERGSPGREASWAGAGMIPPTAAAHDPPPLDAMIRYSAHRHAHWAAQLAEETGLDTGYRRCGALYLARSDDHAERLQAEADRLRQADVEVRLLEPAELAQLEPCLNPVCVNGSRSASPSHGVCAALLLTSEAQLRNPWHLRALVAACRKRGVEVRSDSEVCGFDLRERRVQRIHISRGETIPAGAVCLTSGCWTPEIARFLGVEIDLRPVRGQMLLLRSPKPLLSRIVNDGPRYLVPRDEGRLLVGSTMEDVGYDKRTTENALSELHDFATGIAPSLADLEIEQSWAGLRPATPDGLPYLDRLPGLENAWIAAGHFRLGLTLAPATAEAMAAWMLGEQPPVDLDGFRLDRIQGRGRQSIVS